MQRYFFLDRIKKLGHIETFPRLQAWGKALIERPSTDSFPPAEFEAMYRANVKRRNKWVSQFIETQVKFEDGRTATVAADLRIVEARTFPAVKGQAA